MHKSYDDITIVGLGASAGGFESLKNFIQNIEDDTTVTYVIVQHLDPNQPTLLGTLLERFSKIPILQIKNHQRIQSNTIYLCPPNTDLIIEQGQFLLEHPLVQPYPKPSINRFFKSLAKEKKEKAIGVVLSGTGSDGAEGIVAIKQNGGIVLAENEDAKYFSMPKAAISTNTIDAVLPPKLLAQGIHNALSDRSYFQKHSEVFDNMGKIFNILHQKTGIDFSDYKESTIYRRLEKRMIETRAKDISEYIELLEHSSSEVFKLQKEFLIIVTSLFRDPEAFSVLKTDLSTLITNHKEESLRIWVVGCATGEEAYSLAIAIESILSSLKLTKKAKIFATDVSDEAISEARNRTFTQEEIKILDKEVIKKYFLYKDGLYTPIKSIRDMIVFSKHDVIKDPPFLKLDLISCRNLLIYFNTELQNRILKIFYYALKYEGLMFLGSSENIKAFSNIFYTLNSKYKIYKKANDLEDIDIDSLAYIKKHSFQPSNAAKIKDRNLLDINLSINNALGEFFGKNGIVVDSSGNILYYKGENTYLSYPEGLATNDVYKKISDFLRLDLRAVISESIKKESVSVSKKVRIPSKDNTRDYVVISVFPLIKNKLSEKSYFITFDKIDDEETSEIHTKTTELSQNDLNILENEMVSLKERLQTTIEELETSNEELQSANEELQSTNEELQSTNEELETSNEELQSTNEELRTVNDELEFKNNELGFVNEALHKVVEIVSTDVLILDHNLNLFLHTKGIEKFFKIHPIATRMSLNEIIYNAKTEIPKLYDNVKKVLESKTEIQTDLLIDKKIYWFQIKRIKFNSNEYGVVIGFTDKTELIRNQEIMFQQSKLASMGEMIGNIAHQWRQPLNTLSLNLFSLEEKFNSKSITAKEFKHFSDKARETIEHMSGTINDFRNFFSPNKSEELFSLLEILEKTKTFIVDAFEGIEIDVKINSKEDIKIFGYENEFMQVIINILNNSKDAMQRNHIKKGIIEIELSQEDAQAIISITDNAHGTDEATLKRVFEPYFTTKDKTEGTGIGLYMSKMIIENSMHGTITMNNFKHGMRTTITLKTGTQDANR